MKWYLQIVICVGYLPCSVCFGTFQQAQRQFSISMLKVGFERRRFESRIRCTTVNRNTNGLNALQDINNHQSAQDWLHNVASLPHSTILRDIISPVATVTIWSTFISIVHKILINGSKNMQYFGACMSVSSQFHSFLVSSLGLLLVFRTNSAYQRFVEGRKIWEDILSTSRNLSRLITVYEKNIGPERLESMKNMLAAFPYLLRYHVRKNCLSIDESCKDPIPKKYRFQILEQPMKQMETRYEGDKRVDWNDTKGMIPHICWIDRRNYPWRLFKIKDLQKCAVVSNRPLWVCDRLSKEIASIPYEPNFLSRERLTMIGHVDKLSNAIGECERIHQTGVPLNYARHLLRSLTIWLLTLPFAIVRDLGLLTGPICGTTAWIMFGIYQIGYSIEDPFQKSLRLSILCKSIREDITSEFKNRYSAFTDDDDDDVIIRASKKSMSSKGGTNGSHTFEFDEERGPLLPSDPALSNMLLKMSQSIEQSGR